MANTFYRQDTNREFIGYDRDACSCGTAGTLQITESFEDMYGSESPQTTSDIFRNRSHVNFIYIPVLENILN